MRTRSLSHLSDQVLGSELEAVIQCENTSTAEVLAYIAEFDARKLYAPAGYPSMFAYCVEKLHLSEDAAYKRIRAARAAREFPAIFQTVTDGRLHLCGLSVLASHLTPENARELLAAAERKTRREIERLIAQRFPQPDVPAEVRPLAARAQLAPGP